MENTFAKIIRYKTPSQAASELLRFSDKRLMEVMIFIGTNYDEAMKEYKYWSSLK